MIAFFRLLCKIIHIIKFFSLVFTVIYVCFINLQKFALSPAIEINIPISN